jgi:hypothetical protein
MVARVAVAALGVGGAAAAAGVERGGGGMRGSARGEAGGAAGAGETDSVPAAGPRLPPAPEDPSVAEERARRAAARAAEDAAPPMGLLKHVTGAVSVVTGDTMVPAVAGAPLEDNSWLRLGKDARATVQFAVDGGTVRVTGPGAIRRARAGAGWVWLLARGTVQVEVKGDDRFKVRTPTRLVAASSDTGYAVAVADDMTTWLEVRTGAIRLTEDRPDMEGLRLEPGDGRIPPVSTRVLAGEVVEVSATGSVDAPMPPSGSGEPAPTWWAAHRPGESAAAVVAWHVKWMGYELDGATAARERAAAAKRTEDGLWSAVEAARKAHDGAASSRAFSDWKAAVLETGRASSTARLALGLAWMHAEAARAAAASTPDDAAARAALAPLEPGGALGARLTALEMRPLP